MASMKCPRLQAVQAHPGFTLKLTFVNGQVFDLDLNDDIKHYPGLKPLHDVEAFANAAIGVDGWTVEWSDLDIQIGADTLYLDALERGTTYLVTSAVAHQAPLTRCRWATAANGPNTFER